MENVRDIRGPGLRPGARSTEGGAPNGFDRIKGGIVDSLHRTADGIRSRTEDIRAPFDASGYGAQASTWVHESADQIDRFEPAQLKENLSDKVRKNPGKSLLVAGLAGLIVGAILRRR